MFLDFPKHFITRGKDFVTVLIQARIMFWNIRIWNDIESDAQIDISTLDRGWVES